MESLNRRRKCHLLRLKENCSLRKFCRHNNDASTAAWNNIVPPTSNQSISTAYAQHLHSPGQVEAVADIHMEEDQIAAQNQHNPEDRAEDWASDLDDVDPETGEKAQE
ncbi:uncharacterized protein V6R79_023233 [Siganus canaliculatus]